MWYYNPHTRQATWYPGSFTPGAPWIGPFKTKAGAVAQGKKSNVKGRVPRKAQKAGPSGADIVAAARSWLGVPYLFGGTSRTGVDCSGLVQQVAFAVGISSCPRTSEEQWGWAQHISQSDAGPGDLVFFVGAEIDPPPGHVGILVSPGTMIDAPFTGTVVRYDHFADGPGPAKIIGYGRMIGALKSTTANNNYKTQQSTARGGVTAVEAASGTIITGVIIVLVVLALVILIGTGLLFKGMT